MPERPPLRFLHTSDVHLGAYERVDTERHRQQRATMHEMFGRVIDLGLRERVDFMVIAGDFFDSTAVREDTLHFAAEQIARLEAPVVLVPGNHDHVGPGSVYDRVDLPALAQNLRIMRAPAGETVRLDGLDVDLWGRSHTEQDPDFAPLAGAPARGDAAWHIGVAHGHYIHERALLTGSFHIRQEQIAVLDFDYLAARPLGGAGARRWRRCAGGVLWRAAWAGGHRPATDAHRRSGGGWFRWRLASHSLEDGPEIAHGEIPFLQGA